MKTYSLEELTDKYIGKKGTGKRDIFVFEALGAKVNFNIELNEQKIAY